MRPEHRAAKLEGGAFTLIEILLAVAIFSIVLLAIHMVFYGALQLRNKTTESLQDGLPLQQTLAILKRDLANIVMPGGTLFGEFQTMTLMGDTSTNALNSVNPANDSVPGQSSLAFFTASAILGDDAPWGDVQRVSYYLAPPADNTPGKDLFRSVTRNLLPTFQEQTEDQWLMSGLESMTFSFYDGLQWREYWDSTIETNKLPQGIKVALQMVADSGNTEPMQPLPIELVVPIVLLAGTNDVPAEPTEEEEL